MSEKFLTRVAIWASRLSVAVTIVRIMATGKSLFISKIIAIMFGVICIGIIIQKVILCSPPGDDYACRDRSIISAYTDLATSFLADLWLLGAPTYLLWRMKLKKQIYRLLQAIFATEILVLTTSIFYCVYIVKEDIQVLGVIAHSRVTISLIKRTRKHKCFDNIRIFAQVEFSHIQYRDTYRLLYSNPNKSHDKCFY
ncbi:hypothetical protein BDQ17DRAFT_1330322 [Cyathus striatus]|nr:hypothetical protein BDQ17DRAFT_1330322 [Cyathus striatus]